MSVSSQSQHALNLFISEGGYLRMSRAIRLGINRSMLYHLLEKGLIEQTSRGLFRLTTHSELTNPDLVTISIKYPKGILCLVSALDYYDLTSQIPNRLDVAFPRPSRLPASAYPPIRGYLFSPAAYQAGIEEHVVDGVKIKIYSQEKTLADCFKYRNRIGFDVFLEAIKRYKNHPKPEWNKILDFAGVLRVEKQIKPYLESLI